MGWTPLLHPNAEEWRAAGTEKDEGTVEHATRGPSQHHAFINKNNHCSVLFPSSDLYFRVRKKNGHSLPLPCSQVWLRAKTKEIKMLKQGIFFSPLDELFYNQLPAGVRKLSPKAGFLLTWKVTRGTHVEDLSQGDGHLHTAPLHLVQLWPDTTSPLPLLLPLRPRLCAKVRSRGGGEKGDGEEKGRGGASCPLFPPDRKRIFLTLRCV